MKFLNGIKFPCVVVLQVNNWLLLQVYLDPVRVVSVGVPVGKMTCDPSSSYAIDNPVEFCGGR